jgi:undecaprenyl diphosphate synthase
MSQKFYGVLSFDLLLLVSLSFLSNTLSFLLPKERRKVSTPIQKSHPSVPSSSYKLIHLFHCNTQILCDENPKHVAFICDGNSRWAKKRFLPTSTGHLAGANRLVDLLEDLSDDGIEYCTFYGFSTENWNRAEGEIDSIFRLMEQTARNLAKKVIHEESNIRIRLFGDLEDERIPLSLKTTLKELEQTTSKKQKASNLTQNALTVCLAVNYGGRQDILQASRKLAKAIQDGDVSSFNDITEDTFASYLSTAGIPDPDMIIRTSGESRLSNFMLWNCAYAEIYITPVLWPDFDRSCWQNALYWYQQRHRRFGSRHGRSLDSHQNETVAIKDTE